MSKKEHVSIKSIINDVAIKSGNTLEMDPDSLLYLANGIIDLIIPGNAFVESLSLLDVENYKAKLPNNFKYISQALYRKESDHELPVSTITGYAKKLYGTDCEVEVSLKCDPCADECAAKNLVMDVDYNYIKNNPQWAYNHSKFFYGQRTSNAYYNNKHQSNIFPEFKLMRKTTDHFFNVPYHINECINFNQDSRVEYNIENNNIVVNFKKGQILLAYIGVPTDEEGYRMIPNIEEVYEALYYSLREKIYEQKFDREPNQNNRLAYQMAEQKAMVKRKRATSILGTLDPDEWMMFIRNHWVRTIPNYKWELYGNRYVSDKTMTEPKRLHRYDRGN